MSWYSPRGSYRLTRPRTSTCWPSRPAPGAAAALPDADDWKDRKDKLSHLIR